MEEQMNQHPSKELRGPKVKAETTVATDKLLEALSKANAASDVKSLSPETTVDQALDRWLALHSIGVKPRSIEYNRDIVKFIRRVWAAKLSTPVSQVTEGDCINFATRISAYSPARYNGVINALKSFILAAKIIPRKTPPKPDAKIPTPQLFEQLLAALDSCASGHSALLVRLLAHTGIRINEARQLMWDDVKDDHIYLRGETTKNGRPRTIPFIRGTAEVLRAWKRVSKGKFVITQKDCRRALRYAAQLLSCPLYNHHTFRHYFATRCIVSGVDIPTVAKWLGHTDGGMVLLRTYCHLLDEHSRAMAKRVQLGIKDNPQILVEVQPRHKNVLPGATPVTQTATLLPTMPAASPPAPSIFRCSNN
jgi:integrase